MYNENDLCLYTFHPLSRLASLQAAAMLANLPHARWILFSAVPSPATVSSAVPSPATVSSRSATVSPPDAATVSPPDAATVSPRCDLIRKNFLLRLTSIFAGDSPYVARIRATCIHIYISIICVYIHSCPRNEERGNV